MTFFGLALAILLVISEVSNFIAADYITTISVDLERDRPVDITFDITFPEMSCQGPCDSSRILLITFFLDTEIDLVDEMGKLHPVDRSDYVEESTVVKPGSEGCRIKGKARVLKIKGAEPPAFLP